MTPEETYLFDLCGWIVVPGVLTPEEVADANAAVDAHAAEAVQPSHRRGEPAVPANRTLDDAGRWDLRGMLGWEGEARAPFQRMLAHPQLTRSLNTICGSGFRMDHAPTLITQRKGSPAGTLHGSSGPGFNPASYYIWQDGRMHNGLVVASFQLVDCPAGAGGLAVVQGSHKGNVSMPTAMRQHQVNREFVTQVVCKAGDVVIFSEATTRACVLRVRRPLACFDPALLCP
jgi:hypothetical protein